MAEIRRWPWADALAALLCAATAVVYLASFPLLLGAPDEAHALNEARRVLAGEVMYRDIFEFATPGWPYLMALVFWLFGTTLRVARVTAAVIQGVSVALLFFACRRLAVRTSLAAAAGLVYLTVAEPVWPVASYHWLATALSLLLLVHCIDMRGSARWAFAAGVVVGLISAVHQQRGAAMAGGVLAIIATEGWFTGPSGPHPSWRRRFGTSLAMVAGIFVVIGPLAVAILARAGVRPVWDAVVVFPLVNYRAANHISWGGWLMPVPPANVFARLLTYLPVALPLIGAASLLRYWRCGDAGGAERLRVLTLFAIASLASIAYFPDLVHIALIAPIFLVLCAAACDWSLGVLPARLDRQLGWVTVATLGIACGWQLERNFPVLRPLFSPYESRFGRLPMSPRSQRFHTELDALLDRVPARVLYRYPYSWYTYLLVGAHNPTRFEYMQRGYHSDEHMEEVIASLRAADVPYIVVDAGGLTADDLVYRYILANYEPMTDADMLNGVVWRRKVGSGGG